MFGFAPRRASGAIWIFRLGVLIPVRALPYGHAIPGECQAHWESAHSGYASVAEGLSQRDAAWHETLEVVLARPLRLLTGAFNQTPYACFSGIPQAQPIAGGTITPPASSCGLNVHAGDAIPSILAFWNQYKAGNPLDLN